MKYIVIMYGTTGEYRTEYSSEAKAESAADNIRGLGYEAKVVKQAAQPAQRGKMKGERTMLMTQDKTVQAMRAHGLYCIALTDTGLIGLTDNKGNVYDVVIATPDGLIIDADATMSLADWLGY